MRLVLVICLLSFLTTMAGCGRNSAPDMSAAPQSPDATAPPIDLPADASDAPTADENPAPAEALALAIPGSPPVDLDAARAVFVPRDVSTSKDAEAKLSADEYQSQRKEDKRRYAGKLVEITGRINQYHSSLLDGVEIEFETSEDSFSELSVSLDEEQPWQQVPAHSIVTVQAVSNRFGGKLEHARVISHTPPELISETALDVAQRLESDGIQKAYHDHYKLRQFHFTGKLVSLSDDFATSGNCTIGDGEHALNVIVTAYDIRRLSHVRVGDAVEFLGDLRFGLGQSTPNVENAILVSPQPPALAGPWLMPTTAEPGGSSNVLIFTSDLLGEWSHREPRRLKKLLDQFASDTTIVVELRGEVLSVAASDIDSDEAYVNIKNMSGADIRAVIPRGAMADYKPGDRVGIAAEELGVSSTKDYIWLTGSSGPLAQGREASRIVVLDK